MSDLNNTNTKNWAEVLTKDVDRKSGSEHQKESTDESSKKEAPEIEQLSQQECAIKLTAAEKKVDEYMDKYARILADLKNVQDRFDREIANAHKFAIEKFAFDLLSIIDNLERTLETKADQNGAIQNLYLGVELTLKLFIETLQKFGIVQINPKIGESFDHNQHSAVSVKEDTAIKPNSVIQVLQKGYMLKDRLLRPAMVIVSQ